MKRFDIYFLSLALLAIPFSITANSVSANRVRQNTAAPLAPPLNQSCWSLSVDVLYWYLAQQTGADWSLDRTVTGSETTIAIEELTFPWSVGFGMAAGYRSPNQSWDTELLYTWYRTSNSASTQAPFVLSAYYAGEVLSGITPYLTGDIRWSFLFNMFDWIFRGNYQVGRSFALKPMVGLKGGWIWQKIQTTWQRVGLSAFENLRNNFYGIGPKGGVEGVWRLQLSKSSQFSFFSAFESAYLWGCWFIKDLYQNSVPAEANVIVPDFNFGCLVLGSKTGIEWMSQLNKNQSSVSVRISYDMQLWFDQVQLPTYLIGPLHHNINLQGATFNLQFDF